MKFFVQCILLWLAITTLAFADCNDDEGSGNSILSKCLLPQLSEADRAMTIEYNALLKTLKNDFRAKDTDAKTLLKSAQKAWINYRSQFCSAKGMAIAGGVSSRAIPEVECQLELTESRRYELLNLNSFLSDRNSINDSP